MPDVLPDELYLWQQRAAMLVYSHETALFLLGMAERVPGRQSATLPSDARLSQTFPGDLKLYFVKPELFGIGVSRLPTKMGHTVRAYNAERTLCDVLRSRSRMDDQTVAFALKCYVARNEKDLNLLGEYAALFHVTKALRAYLEVLL
jgi:hypothetical protein